MKRISYLILTAIFWGLFMTACTTKTQFETNAPPEPRHTSTVSSIRTQTNSSINFKKITINDGSLQAIPPNDILEEVSIVPIGGGWDCTYEDVAQPTLIRFPERGVPERLSNPATFTIRRFDGLGVGSCGWMIGENVRVTTTYPDGNIDSYTEIYDGINVIGNHFSTGEDTLLGEYLITFKGSATTLTVNINVEESTWPKIVEIDFVTYKFYHFKPNEEIRFFRYRDDMIVVGTLVGWTSFNVGVDGNLIVNVPDSWKYDRIVIQAMESDYIYGLDFGISTIFKPDITQENDSYSTTSDCSGASPSRLSIDDTARVTYSNGISLRIRSEPGLDGSKIGLLAEGTKMDIIGGPECMDSFLWWKVKTEDGIIGWVAEGSNGDYMIEPWP
jgi:hypothetical protein